MTAAPSFPPLFHGMAAAGGDPFDMAQAQAALGTDAGLVVHDVAADRLRAAIVFAPEEPLGRAMRVLVACGVGFQNALGALAPPEVAVHLEWDGGLRVNGASCGQMQVAASTTDPEVEPDWLVVGLTLPLMPEDDDPGARPDRTCLYEEGCVDVDALALLESWVRHTLHWVNRMLEDGNRPLHDEWRGLAHGVGEEVTMLGQTGTYVGVDEAFGLLLRDGETTHLIPLTRLLEA